MSIKNVITAGALALWDDPQGFGERVQAVSGVFRDIYEPIGRSFAESRERDIQQKKARNARRKKSDGVKFIIKNGEAKAKGLTDSCVCYVQIPSFIKKKGIRYPVTKISKDAFRIESFIQTVSIDEGIEEIGAGAFYLCSDLCEVYLPDTLEYIGAGAFSSCSSLRDIYIPPSARIHPDAFNGGSVILWGYGANLLDFARKRKLRVHALKDADGFQQIQVHTGLNIEEGAASE